MSKIIKYSILASMLLFIYPVVVWAQVDGYVTDAETGEPLPFVNIFYKENTSVGTNTNLNGYYKISADGQGKTLVFSYMGFGRQEITVRKGNKRRLNVRLKPMSTQMKEVVIQTGRRKYNRKNNPAVTLMEKVIAAKDGNDLKENDFFSYTKYQRLTFAFNNVTQADLDSGIYRRLPALSRQAEYCPQTGKMIIPVTYNESVSKRYYRKCPKEDKEFLLGTNAQGLQDLFSSGEMTTTILKQVFSDVNVYDNTIYLLDRPFTSPTSKSGALTFYQYYLMDTLQIGTDSCIQVAFVPRNPRDFGFSGNLFVVKDSTYSIKRCVLNLPVQSSVNFVNNLVLEQDFEILSNGQHVLVRDNMIAEMGITQNNRNLMVKRMTSYSAFNFDSIPEHVFKQPEKLREGSYETDDEHFWTEYRTDSLSHGEANMRMMVQNILKRPGIKAVMFVARALIENYLETAPVGKTNYVDIGPVNTILSTNFIDKVRFRLSAQTTAHLNPHLFLKGYAAYGIADKKIKYRGEVEYSFLKKQYSANEFPKNSLAVSAGYDVMSSSDILSTRDKDNVFVSFKTQPVDHMMYVRDYAVRYEYEFMNSFSIKAQLRHAQQEPTAGRMLANPVGSLYYRTLSGRDVRLLKTSEATLALRFSPGEVIVNSKQKRHRVNNNSPIYTLSHTTGFKGILGADYRSNYSEVSLYHRIWFNSFGHLDLYLRAGAQWNQVPFPLLIMPAANNSYIITNNLFFMINNMEFISDRFASFELQWNLNGKLFNRIPLLRDLQWRELIGFRTYYGALTRKNNPLYHPGSDQLFEFPTRNGQQVSFAMGNVPYMELNVGIHNIFKILRIDYVRRLNYLDLPNVKKNGIRFSLEFSF